MKRTPETNNILEEMHDYCIDINKRAIYLHDDFKEEDSGIDFRVATKFIKNIFLLEGTDGDITIHMHSFGGIVEPGFAIYDSIINASHHVNIICHGACMSMASIILQAADMRYSLPNCTFMLHQGSQYISGTHKQFQTWANHSKIWEEKVMKIYVERAKNAPMFAGKNEKQVRAYIQANFDKKEDWILTAEDALTHGFIDKILVRGELNKLV